MRVGTGQRNLYDLQCIFPIINNFSVHRRLSPIYNFVRTLPDMHKKSSRIVLKKTKLELFISISCAGLQFHDQVYNEVPVQNGLEVRCTIQVSPFGKST